MTGSVVTEGGNLIVTEGDRLVLYPDRRKMLRRLNLQAACILLPVAAALFGLFGLLQRLLIAPVPSFIDTEFAILPWFITVLYGVLYVAMLATISRARLPIVTISPEGLTLHTVLTQVGLLRWGEIGEVRPYTMIYRYVGVVPRDPDALYRRLGRRGLLVRLNSWCVPLYRAFGIFIAPINIPQEYLPVTADELAARIRAARPAAPIAGVWPPAPQKSPGKELPNG